MDLLNIRTKVITEINLIPEDKLEELYNFIHYWRLNGESSPGSLEQTMQFAGCCQMKHLLISVKKSTSVVNRHFLKGEVMKPALIDTNILSLSQQELIQPSIFPISA
ncbi:hypothetical protein RI030_08605 [Aphanizomenon flos-aquae NRERC-008]|uniref:hypothetical protein n=1 Tax=Aphanizomenon TaxID=1175 RepID=UPI001F54AD46|nr:MULTISPECIES: hypothetical protein [Aphanizomenon]MDS9397653.1 hypothetical protein [Aphanizomenon flos-aquae NRERC-008]